MDAKLITAHWDDVLRLAASVRTGRVSASLMLKRLGAYPRQNGLALALREVGRVERTLFTLDWLQDVGLRRRAQIGLNKGEARHALARALFFNRLGELRDRGREPQSHKASGLNLLTAAIVLWNTAYLEKAVAALRGRGQLIPDELLSSAFAAAAREEDRAAFVSVGRYALRGVGRAQELFTLEREVGGLNRRG